MWFSNVVVVIFGLDFELKEEYMVVMGYYDYVGVGK